VPSERKALDGARRRRLYLFRHGSVDYIDRNGDWVADPDVVELNEEGRAQADAMADSFSGIAVDRAVCSGLLRTRQTGKTILAGRGIELEVISDLEEIRPTREKVAGGQDVFADVAFSHWRAPDDDARFLGGERYSDFYARVVGAMESLLANNDWNDLAIFAHGGTNAAVLGWVTGLGLDSFGVLDQEPCCLNIVDFDTIVDGDNVVRKTVRAVNITVNDALKRDRHASDMEMLAGLLIKTRSKG
jgi:probable phosphoglycerate mutase